MKAFAVAALLAGTLISSNGFPMDFKLDQHIIFADGEIQDGDAKKLEHLIRNSDLNPLSDYVVRLNSPGGSLLEGIQIGTVIRAATLQTFISRGDICASACALAFLGGTKRYATGTGIGRRMEFGAILGFHGFRNGTDVVSFENKTFTKSRIATALILEYASEMKGVDLGWLAQAQNVPPEKLRHAKSPADIAALSITLEGMPQAVPKDWYLNACRRAVRDMMPVLDEANRLASAQIETIPTIKALREAIVSARFQPGSLASAVATLSDSDAIDLALGEPFYLNIRKPILDARIIFLERGAGFYYDRCITVRTKNVVSAILIDLVSHRVRLRTFDELAAFDSDTPLW